MSEILKFLISLLSSSIFFVALSLILHYAVKIKLEESFLFGFLGSIVFLFIIYSILSYFIENKLTYESIYQIAVASIRSYLYKDESLEKLQANRNEFGNQTWLYTHVPSVGEYSDKMEIEINKIIKSDDFVKTKLKDDYENVLDAVKTFDIYFFNKLSEKYKIYEIDNIFLNFRGDRGLVLWSNREEIVDTGRNILLGPTEVVRAPSVKRPPLRKFNKDEKLYDLDGNLIGRPSFADTYEGDY